MRDESSSPPERRDIGGSLAGATLTTARMDVDYSPVALMPDVKVIKVGGQSMLDRGRAAIFPLLDELVPLKDKYQLLLCCGGGTRVRHTVSVALDLGLPTGGVAQLVGAME